MVELKNGDQASGVADCTQGDAAETPRKIVTVTDLNEEQLEGIFSEEDPHKQFEFFASCLGLPKPESMSILNRIAAEYDYLNVMFCREQNFTAEQTIAFRGITQSVFEAGIVRGELDVNEAFQEFTERVLSLAGEPDAATTTTTNTNTTTQDHTLSNEPSATSLTSGVFPNTNGGGDGGRGSPPAAETRRTSGKSSSKAVAGSKAKEVVVDPKLAGKSSVPASKSHRGVSGGGGGGAPRVGSDCSGSDSGGGSSSGSGGAGGVGAGPVFSVGDVAAITLFVARGLYRNFALYRMCFERPAKHCTEVREVQVETPLEPAPLHQAEPVA